MTAPDLQRPRYDRKTGDIAILLDILDAEPLSPEQLGSRQYFLVNLAERFAGLLQKSDLLKLRRFFSKRQLLLNTSIEYFTDCCLCVLCPSSPEGLRQLRADAESGQLQKHFADCFVTPVALRKLRLKSLRIRVRSWPDEFDSAAEEWQRGQMPCKYDMNANEKSRRMLLQVRRFQVSRLQRPSTGALPRLREAEAKFESNLTGLINYVKMLLGGSLASVETLAGLAEMRADRPELSRSPDARHLDEYLSSLRDLAAAIDSLDAGVAEPLGQLRVGGETIVQVAKRTEAFGIVAEIRAALDEAAPLRLRHEGIFGRISASERIKIGCLLSLLPCTVRMLADFDEALDAYFNAGNVHFKPAELGITFD